MTAGRITVALIILGLAAKAQDRAAFGLPVMFERNIGQLDPAVIFASRGPGYSVQLTDSEVVFRGRQSTVTMMLVGGEPRAKAVGRRPLPTRINYLIGPDPAAWHTDVPTYAGVEYRNIYPGIDLTFYGNKAHLEYDFVVAPGADPARIRLRFQGMEEM